MNLKQCLKGIVTELESAERKFPTFPKDPIHAAAVIAEESGELQQAALQWTYENGRDGQVMREATQTAVMALRFMLNFNAMKPIKSEQVKRVAESYNFANAAICSHVFQVVGDGQVRCERCSKYFPMVG